MAREVVQDHHRQETVTDKKPDHTSSIDPADDAEAAAALPADALTEDDKAIGMASAADAVGLKIACGTGSISVAFVRSDPI